MLKSRFFLLVLYGIFIHTFSSLPLYALSCQSQTISISIRMLMAHSEGKQPYNRVVVMTDHVDQPQSAVVLYKTNSNQVAELCFNQLIVDEEDEWPLQIEISPESKLHLKIDDGRVMNIKVVNRPIVPSRRSLCPKNFSEKEPLSVLKVNEKSMEEKKEEYRSKKIDKEDVEEELEENVDEEEFLEAVTSFLQLAQEDVSFQENTPSFSDIIFHKYPFLAPFFSYVIHFIQNELITPTETMPALILGGIRMILMIVNVSLYSWRTAMALMGGYIGFIILQIILNNFSWTARWAKWLRYILLICYMISAPKIFLTSMGIIFFASIIMMFINKVARCCGRKTDIFPSSARVLLCSFLYGFSQVTLDVFRPNWYLPYETRPPIDAPNVCNGMRGGCSHSLFNSKAVVVSHNFAANGWGISMQSGSLYEQLQDGVRVVHTKYVSYSNITHCEVKTSLGSLHFDLGFQDLTFYLDQIYSFVKENPKELVTLILDDTQHTRGPDSCMIQTLQSSPLFSFMFPQTLQIGKQFSPNIQEVLDWKYQVLLYYFNFERDMINNLEPTLLSSLNQTTWVEPHTGKVLPLFRLWKDNTGVLPSWSFLGTNSARVGSNYISDKLRLTLGGPYEPIAFVWKLLSWNKLQIEDLLSDQVVNHFVERTGDHSFYIATNYDIPAVGPVPSALINLHAQEYFDFLVKKEKTPTLMMMNHFQYSQAFRLQECLMSTSDWKNYKQICQLGDESRERLFLLIKLFLGRCHLWTQRQTITCSQLVTQPSKGEEHSKKELDSQFFEKAQETISKSSREPSDYDIHIDIPEELLEESPEKKETKRGLWGHRFLQGYLYLRAPFDSNIYRYFGLFRTIFIVASTSLYSYQYGLALLAFSVTMMISYRYLPRHLRRILEVTFFVLQMLTRPLQVTLGLSVAWGGIAIMEGMNRVLPKVGVSPISTERRNQVASFLFGLTEVGIELLYPQLYLRQGESGLSHSTLNQFKSQPIFNLTTLGTHDSFHNTPMINVQDLSIRDQILKGSNFIHIEFINQPGVNQTVSISLRTEDVIRSHKSVWWPINPSLDTSPFFNESGSGSGDLLPTGTISPTSTPPSVDAVKCNLWVVHGSDDIKWDLMPMYQALSEIAKVIKETKHPLGIIFDQVSDKSSINCLVKDIQQSELYPLIYPFTLQIGTYFQPTIQEIEDSGFLALTFLRAFEKERFVSFDIERLQSAHPLSSFIQVTSMEEGEYPVINFKNISEITLNRQRSWFPEWSFLGSTQGQRDGMRINILDWKVFQENQLLTTNLAHNPNRGMDDPPIVVNVATDFGVFSWHASVSELYNYHLFEYYNFLLEKGRQAQVIFLNHIEYSEAVSLQRCLNSIDDPKEFMTLCDLPNEKVRLGLALCDRFIQAIQFYPHCACMCGTRKKTDQKKYVKGVDSKMKVFFIKEPYLQSIEYRSALMFLVYRLKQINASRPLEERCLLSVSEENKKSGWGGKWVKKYWNEFIDNWMMKESVDFEGLDENFKKSSLTDTNVNELFFQVNIPMSLLYEGSCQVTPEKVSA